MNGFLYLLKMVNNLKYIDTTGPYRNNSKFSVLRKSQFKDFFSTPWPRSLNAHLASIDFRHSKIPLD